MHNGGYRDLVSKPVIGWALTAFAGRLPIAMAPLAMVFLVRQESGGYTLGAFLAATYVVGEVVGAPLLGLRIGSRTIRVHLSVGLTTGGCAFAALAWLRSAPDWTLVALAFLAGAAPAAGPGGMRSLLTGMLPERHAARALSVDTMLTQLVWAVAPAAVVVLALRISPGAPLILAAVSAVVAALLMFLLPTPDPTRARHAADSEHRSPASTARTLLSAWPIYLTSAAAMALLATAELVLPALLEYRGVAVAWAGPMLTVFAVVSALGALCYGLRTWPGGVRAQSTVFLTITAVCVTAMALLPGLIGIGLALVTAGFFQAGVLVTRNLSLTERLPSHVHTAAYSIMYSATGIGYSLTATITAAILAHRPAPAAILTGAAVTLVLTAGSSLAERRTRTSGRSGSPRAAETGAAGSPAA